MASNLKKRGDSASLHIQPGGEIEYEQDGLIRAVVVWEGDSSLVANVPRIGDPHPGESAAFVYHRRITYLTLFRIRATVNYIGLAKDPTDYIIEGMGALNREPIDTHKDFVSKIGGPDQAHHKNLCNFNDDGSFANFPAIAPNDMAGVESYNSVGVNIRRTYWTGSVPSLRKIGKIVAKPSNILVPSNVKNFLSGPITYRQVGKIFQVSEEFLGSGPKGWNPLIYGT